MYYVIIVCRVAIQEELEASGFRLVKNELMTPSSQRASGAMVSRCAFLLVMLVYTMYAIICHQHQDEWNCSSGLYLAAVLGLTLPM